MNQDDPVVYTEEIQPSQASWNQIKEAILEIEHVSFAEKSYSEAELTRDFTDLSSIIIILRESKNNRVIGYSYTIPDEEEDQAAYVCSVAILPAFRGKGLVGRIMQVIEDKARARGYVFLTMDAATHNGYADTTQRHYKDRVVQAYDHDSFWGPQRYMKIKL